MFASYANPDLLCSASDFASAVSSLDVVSLVTIGRLRRA